MKKRLLSILLTVVMIISLLPVSAFAGGPSSITLGNFDETTHIFKDATGQGTDTYKYIAIYLGETMGTGDSVNLPTVSGYTVNEKKSYAITVAINPAQTAQEIAENYISEIVFNFTDQQTVQVVLMQNVPPAGLFFNGLNGHYYQFVEFNDGEDKHHWIDAYNAAKGMTFDGRTGYLATITSLEEDLLVYNASKKVGFLGGTVLIHGDESGNLHYDFTVDNNSNYNKSTMKEWYWACGPERGQTFFKASDTDTFHDNYAYEYNKNLNYYFNWYNNEPNGGDEDNKSDECCLTTLAVGAGYAANAAGISIPASWNDMPEHATSDFPGASAYEVKGYFVEFGDQVDGDSHASSNLSATGYIGYHSHNDIDFTTAWDGGTEHNSMPNEAGNYVLTSDITLSGTWSVPTGTVNLCLNGHVISRANTVGENDNFSMITVSSGATLNLYDCDSTTSHAGYVDENGLWHLGSTVPDGCTEKTVKGGVITGGTGTLGNVGGTNGGGVFVDGGTLAMFGGNIVGNSVTSVNPIVNQGKSNGMGGGVFVYGGTFEMNGGTICGNANIGYANSGEGGGVNVIDGFFKMSGTAKICENTIWCGGGVEVGDGASFIMEGGTISGNIASGDGAAAGGVEISGNDNTRFIMTGGKITDNIAIGTNAYAGGVELGKGTVKLGGTAKISGNLKGTDANNLYLNKGKTIIIASGDNVPTDTMDVGIKMEEPGVFTDSNETYASYAKYFTSDDPAYGVVFNSDKKLKLEQGQHIHDGINFKEWEKTDSLPTEAGNYYLTTDVAITSTWNVTTGATKLCLNGHVITASGSGFSVITIGSGVTLDLYDCDTTTEHYFAYSSAGAWTWNEDSKSEGAIAIDRIADSTKEGKLIVVIGGCITGGNAGTGTNCRGVYVSGGAFTMYGGNLIGNSAGNNNGGGVYVYSGGAFNMSGGAIIGNYAQNGGGVSVSNGKFVLNKGFIANNVAANVGGGVSLENSNGNIFEIHDGGIISKNFAKKNGGGVFVNSNGTFRMTNGKITNNIALGTNGGGVVNGGTFNMSGGMITNNTASASNSNGGGVFNAGTFNMTGGKIADNTASAGGGVYYNGVTVTLGGTAQITGNTKDDGTANNLYLLQGKTVALATGEDAPKEDMSVGVTTQAEPTTVSPVAITADNNKCVTTFFKSDHPSYEVADESNHLVLKLTPPKTITFDANGGTCAPESARTSAGGKLAELPTATRNGYTFNGWYTLAFGGENITTSTVFTSDTTIYAQWTEISAPPAPVYYEDPVYTVPVMGDKSSVQVKATISGSNATVKNITSEEIETVGTGLNVIVDLTGVPKSVTAVTIPKSTFDNVAVSEADGLEIQFPNGNVAVFDKTVLTAISDQAEGNNIRLVVDRDSKAERSMTSEQKEIVETLNNPVVLDAYFISNGKRISDFRGGEAELTAVYPTKNLVRVWYIKSDGTKELIPCSCDGENAIFVVTHFSHYVIEQLDASAYAVCPQDETCVYAHFTDADTKAWYHSGVHFCVENGIMEGIAEHTFDPSGPLSRGMIATMIWRMEGKPSTDYEMTFTDVEEGKWYTEAVCWAESVGVVEGYSDEIYGPKDNVTREQLAAILMRYAEYKGIEVSERADLSKFTDAEKVSGWALENIKWANAVGIIEGRSETTIAPKDDSSRAEAGCMVQRFCENILTK